MATIVVMPQLGNSVESCIIVEWMIAEGDTVAVDQTLASIETRQVDHGGALDR